MKNKIPVNIIFIPLSIIILAVLFLTFNISSTASAAQLELKQQSGSPIFTDIFSGWMHTCGLTTSGGVMCWGKNARQDGNRTQKYFYTENLLIEKGIC